MFGVISFGLVAGNAASERIPSVSTLHFTSPHLTLLTLHLLIPLASARRHHSKRTARGIDIMIEFEGSKNKGQSQAPGYGSAPAFLVAYYSARLATIFPGITAGPLTGRFLYSTQDSSNVGARR